MLETIQNQDEIMATLELIDSEAVTGGSQNKPQHQIRLLRSDLEELTQDQSTIQEMAGCDIECDVEIDPNAIQAIRDVYSNLLAIPAEVQGQIFSFRMEINSYLLGHATRVAIYSALLAQQLGEDPVLAAISGFLHDIGKNQKKQKEISEIEGKLTDEQYEEMKNHPTFGAMAMQALNIYENGKYLPFDSKYFREVYDAILNHHVRPDRGRRSYPQYTDTSDNSIIPKIVAVADSFDAMASNRSYKEAKAMEAQIEYGLSEVKRWAGAQFDTEVAETFCELEPTPRFSTVEELMAA